MQAEFTTTPVIQTPEYTVQTKLPRVLYMVTSDSAGGIERHSVCLAAHLKARGLPITYACRVNEFVETQAVARGIPTFPMELKNSGDLQAVRLLADLIHREAIEVVHVHSRRDFLPALLAVALARRRRRPDQCYPRLILHVHLVRSLGSPARLNGWFFARGTDAILTVSKAVRTHVLQDRTLPKSLVRVLKNGVDTSAFAEPNSHQAIKWRAQFRHEWNIAADAPTIGMIGRLDAKGQKAMLLALPKILKHIPDLRLVLVGPDGRPGDRQRLQALAKKIGVLDQVIFTGHCNDIPAALTAFDLLAHLPIDDAFPSTLIEAMAAGLPVITTNAGGCPEIVVHEKTGLVIPTHNPPALVAAIKRLLNGQRGCHERTRMGTAGRTRAIAELSLDTQVDQLLEFYQHLCRQKTH